eukprot:70589_1
MSSPKDLQSIQLPEIANYDDHRAFITIIKPQKFKRGERLKRTPSYSFEKAISAVGFGRFQRTCSFALWLGWISIASQLMITLFLIRALPRELGSSSAVVACVSVAFFAGAAVGALIWRTVAARVGSRVALIGSTVVAASFSAVSAAMPNVYVLMAARFFAGAGIYGLRDPLSLIGEFMPKTKSISIAYHQMVWTCGIVIGALIGSAAFLMCYSWRIYLGISTIPTFLHLFACALLPRSARLLLSTGRRKDVVELLRRMSVMNEKDLPPGEFDDKQSVQVKEGSFQELLKRNGTQGTLLLWLVWFCFVFCYFGSFVASVYILESDAAFYIGMVIIPVFEFLGILMHDISKNYLALKASRAIKVSSGLLFAMFSILLTSWIPQFKETISRVIIFSFIRAMSSNCIAVCGSLARDRHAKSPKFHLVEVQCFDIVARIACGTSAFVTIMFPPDISLMVFGILSVMASGIVMTRKEFSEQNSVNQLQNLDDPKSVDIHWNNKNALFRSHLGMLSNVGVEPVEIHFKQLEKVNLDVKRNYKAREERGLSIVLV